MFKLFEIFIKIDVTIVNYTLYFFNFLYYEVTTFEYIEFGIAVVLCFNTTLRLLTRINQ